MSSRKHRIDEVVNLIRAHQGDSDVDYIISARTGYSKAFIAALRADIKSGRYHEEES